MSVETAIEQARSRVADEQTFTSEKRAAFERFRADLADIDASQPSGGAIGGGGPTRVVSAHTSGTDVSAVLSAFETHLGEYCGDATDTHDSVHEAVAAEFSTELAVSLCGGDSAGTLTPQLKQVVVAETNDRLAELQVMERALDREAESLAAVGDPVESVCSWFSTHDATPLTDLGFEALRERHDELASHREALTAAAAERQETLHATTGGPDAVGIEQDVLVEYLYAGFEATHPALATLARLDSLCADAQRTVRAHLCARA